MQYLIWIAQLVLIIALVMFVVIFGLKACSFLDGLAKMNDINDFPEGFPFEQLLRKPNRNKKENSIRKKFRERLERYDKRERRE